MQPEPTKSPVELCKRCAKPHLTRDGTTACTAHRTTKRDINGIGWPCSNYPVKDMTVCRMHGGGSPQAKRMVQERSLTAAVAEKANRIFGKPLQIDPAEGLIREYWRSAGLVRAYELVVTGLADDDLVWGIVERVEENVAPAATDGEQGKAQGGAKVTQRANVSIWVKLFNEERDRNTKLGQWIVEKGLEARRDEYIKAQVQVFASVLLHPELALSADQRRAAGRLLRQLEATPVAAITGKAAERDGG